MQMYTGGCHCGRVRYQVTMELDSVLSCNCSICSKLGLLLAFVPQSQFTLLSGESDLTEYRFNKKTISHLFCSTCGVESFAKGAMPDGTEMRAINVRCLEGVDTGMLSITPVDGKNM